MSALFDGLLPAGSGSGSSTSGSVDADATASASTSGATLDLTDALKDLAGVLTNGVLHLPDLTNVSNLTVTTNGATTTLTALGSSISVPTADLMRAGEAGQVAHSQDTATYGMDGNDTIHDGSGNDYTAGGSGNDWIDGGAGNDHLYGYGATAGADGNDTISGGDGDDYIQGNAGDDILDGGNGNDRIQGGADNDTITGGAGNDQINGNLGNDHIDGGTGDDILRGGKGDDVIIGGDGNDQISGDLGADTLTGGAGHDVFHFHGSDAAFLASDMATGHLDTITDFTVGEDQIDIGFHPGQILLTNGLANTVADALTIATSLLAGHNGDAVAVEVGNDTLLFYSSSGGSLVDSAIDLQGVHAGQSHAGQFYLTSGLSGGAAQALLRFDLRVAGGIASRSAVTLMDGKPAADRSLSRVDGDGRYEDRSASGQVADDLK